MGLPPLRAAAPPPLPFIIQHVVERFIDEQKRLQTMQYNQLTLIDELDDTGQVVRHQERKMIIRPGTDKPVEDISVKGDQLSTDAAQKSRRVGVRKNVDQGRQQFSLGKMVDRFNVTYVGPVDLAGRPAYLLGFEPKPDQAYDNQTEHVLNYLHGRIWINPANYSILQSDAHLVGPVSIGYILATIKQLDFHYNFQGKSLQDLGPAEITVTVLVDIPIWPTIHQRQKIEVTDFRPRE